MTAEERIECLADSLRVSTVPLFDHLQREGYTEEEAGVIVGERIAICGISLIRATTGISKERCHEVVEVAITTLRELASEVN